MDQLTAGIITVPGCQDKLQSHLVNSVLYLHRCRCVAIGPLESPPSSRTKKERCYGSRGISIFAQIDVDAGDKSAGVNDRSCPHRESPPGIIMAPPAAGLPNRKLLGIDV